MTKTLEYLLKYLAILYLDPRYRITDSSTTGEEQYNASLRLTSDTLSWRLVNDRGQVRLAVAPTQLESPENWFRITIVRQYIDHEEEQGTLLTDDLAAWVQRNVDRVEALFFNDSIAASSCRELIALEEAKAVKLFGPVRKGDE